MRSRTRPATAETTSTVGNARGSVNMGRPAVGLVSEAPPDAGVRLALTSGRGCAMLLTACWTVWQSKVVAISQATARTSCDPSSPATISSDI
jgi:hypothetical protein